MTRTDPLFHVPQPAPLIPGQFLRSEGFARAPIWVDPNRRLKVLLVEDNPGDARLIFELLRENLSLFDPVVVGRLSEVFEIVKKEEVHLILLDLTLPDSRGIETFRRVYERLSYIPIIVLSGLDDEELALRTVQEGAQDYLTKGQFDRAALVRAMRYSIERMEFDRVLDDERALLRNVLENIIDAVYVKDEQGRYVICNSAFARFLGRETIDEVMGKKASDFFGPDVVADVLEDDREVMETGRPIINREVNFDEGKRWISVTKVPYRDARGKVIGVLGIERDISGRKKVEEQLYRYNAEIRQRNEELVDDLHMAREIQQAFLPQQFPTFPRRVSPSESAIRFFSRYIPTTEVGGDFFHVLPISDYEAGIFICDVMGHGVRAALVTAIQRALVEEMINVAGDPGRFLEEINRALISILRRARTPMFASAFYLVVNVEEGVIHFANAGHPHPLHLSRETGRVEFLASGKPGSALGLFRESVYYTRTCPVSEGDLIMLFTDGLYEVEGEGERLFDQEMLMRTVRQWRQEPTDVLISKTLASVQDFALDHTFEDDVCLVGVEIDRILAAAAAVGSP